jgi:hypothetical protein
MQILSGGMSCILAWQQILKHSLAFMGNKRNHLTWQKGNEEASGRNE